MKKPSTTVAVLAEIRDDADQRVATLRCRLADDRLFIETSLEDAADAWRDTLAPLCTGAIKLLPNGMLRVSVAEGEEVGLSDLIHEVAGGRLYVVKDSHGIEQGLAMKQQAWSQEEHSIPFHRFVARLQDTSRQE